MVAADADRVPARHVTRAEFDSIDDEAQRGFGREEKLFLRDILFQYIVLQRPTQRGHRKAALLSIGDIHGPDSSGGTIDGHRGRHLIQGQIGEENLHIGKRGDGHAALAKLAYGQRMIGIVAVQSRHVERGREARLALFEQVFEAGVGVFGGSEASEHTHGPGFGAVHRWLHATRVGILAGQGEVARIVEARVILWHVETVYGDARSGDKVVALRHACERLLHGRLFPGRALHSQAFQFSCIKECALFDNRLLRLCRFLLKHLDFSPPRATRQERNVFFRS